MKNQHKTSNIRLSSTPQWSPLRWKATVRHCSSRRDAIQLVAGATNGCTLCYCLTFGLCIPCFAKIGLKLMLYCVTFAEIEPYCHSGMFVWMSVGHATAAGRASGWCCCCAAASAALADGVSRIFLPLRTWRIVPYDLFSFTAEHYLGSNLQIII